MKIRAVNWAQALVEVLLLLSGAGLALALDMLNDERRERRAEAEYLTSLKSEFEQTRDNFLWAVNGNSAVVQDNLRLLELLSGPPESIPLDSISRRSAQNFWWYQFEPVMGTYIDLLNSGRLEVLRSDSLRYALTQFESQLNRLQLETAGALDIWFQILMPFVMEKLSFSEYMERHYLGADFPPSHFSLDPDVIWSEGFENLLTITVIHRQQLVHLGESQLEDVETILRLIEKAQSEL